MIMPKPIHLAFIALLLMSLCHPATALTAGNVSSINTTRWPPVVIEGQTIGLVVIAGRPVIIHSAGASILKEDRSGWIAADLRDKLLIRGVISDGQQAFALLGGGGRQADINRLARLELDGSALRLRPLAPLPVSLTSAVGTTHGTAIFVAGVGPDGVSRLLELSTSAESEIWTAHAGWTGGGHPTSLVMQNSAV
jgi:solute:Na+ symporter, SSS family